MTRDAGGQMSAAGVAVPGMSGLVRQNAVQNAQMDFVYGCILYED